MEKFERNILIIIFLSFAIRLIHITDPPIEVSHNWRQTTSLMVARNFYQQNNNILYPTLDETGEKPGIVGMEFPALPYSIYLISELFGYDHWYGRLIGLIVVCIGLYYFFLLVCQFFDKKTAFYATIALTFSALFHLARKVLPDPISLSLVIIGLYYGTIYLRHGKWVHLLVFFITAALGTLIKIPFGAFLIVLAFPFFEKATINSRRILFAICSLCLVGVVYWWYFVWNFHLAETYGLWYNSGRSIKDGIREIGENFGDVLERFYFSAFHSYFFFALTLAGLGFVIYRRNKKMMWLLVAFAPFFIGYLFKSGFLFAHHGYYALVAVPVMALLVGIFLQELPRKWAASVLLIGIGESVANQQHDFFIKDREFVKLQLAEIANQLSTPSDKVALVSNQNPNEFYFLNRKGWMIAPTDLNSAFLTDLSSKGCRLLFMRKGKYDQNLPLKIVFENQDYLVFEL